MKIVSIHFTHGCTHVLYKQLIQTGSVLLLLLLSSVLGFPLYKDTANERAATHQLYSFAIEVWLGANDQPTLLLSIAYFQSQIVFRN